MPQPSSKLETIVVTPFQQNCTILWDQERRTGVVIDPGGDIPEILERITALGITIEAILLTHGHLDHAGGVEALREALGNRSDGTPVPVIGPDRRDLFLLSGIAAQAASFGIKGMRDARPDRYLEEGEVLELAGRRLEVLLVPGHTPGHVVFFDRAARMLIAGDTLFAGSVGRTDFPYGDGPLLIRSIKEKLLPLGDDVVVFPGHGPATSVGDERRSSPFLR
jgi:glyoxylase-like metal-dependent hydrolase (beta-lactamase superfamily II)